MEKEKNNTEKKKEKYIIRVINGVPYKVVVHYKNKGEIFQDKLKRIIKNKVMNEKNN